MTAGGARSRILARVRAANRGRTVVPHPGSLPPSVEPPAGPARPAEAFGDRFRAAGGEVVRLRSRQEAGRWLETFAARFRSVSLCKGIPGRLRPLLPELPPEEAELGVSMAVGAAAQTGSLLLSSREGRRPQLLPPTHLVWVHARDIRTTLTEALAAERGGLPATLALHSGPSKSADIGQIMVTGVHGPGRIVAAILGEEAAPRRAVARQGKGPRGESAA